MQAIATAGHRACRTGVRCSPTGNGLQPPGACRKSSRGHLPARPFRKTGSVRRTDRRDLGKRRVDACLLGTPRWRRSCSSISTRASSARFSCGGACRSSGGKRWWRRVPGGRRAGVPATSLGKRHQADPDQGDARWQLHYDRWWNPAVEDQNSRPRLPDRAGPPGAGAPADRRGTLHRGTVSLLRGEARPRRRRDRVGLAGSPGCPDQRTTRTINLEPRRGQRRARM